MHGLPTYMQIGNQKLKAIWEKRCLKNRRNSQSNDSDNC